MSAEEDLQKARSRPDDVLAAVLEDHAELKRLIADVESSTGAARAESFRAFTHLLIVHETAEQEIIHPLARQAEGGDAVVDQRLEEEKEGEEMLSRLEDMDVDDPDFDSAFAELKADVIDHAEHEESDEFPLIEREIDQETLTSLAGVFRAAERTAPTHPHPSSPTSAVGNLAVGPFAAVADRTRDAINAARGKD